MGSHRDEDSPIHPKAMRDIAEMRASLRERAEESTLQRENLITAGDIDERVLFETTARGLLVRRLEDDPDRVMRVSIGAPMWSPNEGYLVFRGDPAKVYALVKRAERVLRNALNLQRADPSEGGE